MKKTLFTLTLLTVTPLLLLAENEEEPFNKQNAAINESFIKVIVKSRVHNGMSKSSSYKSIDSKEEFLDALKAGDFNNEPVETNNITTQYVYTEIKNIHIDKNDLKDLEGDSLNLGTHIKNGKITHILNIKNSKIKTDKEIDLSVSLDEGTMSDVTTSTHIENSQLLGKVKSADDKIENSLIDADDGLLPLD